jgi:hypothetical protein
LSRQCGILNISQPYRPPRPVTGIASLYYFRETWHLHLQDKRNNASEEKYSMVSNRLTTVQEGKPWEGGDGLCVVVPGQSMATELRRCGGGDLKRLFSEGRHSSLTAGSLDIIVFHILIFIFFGYQMGRQKARNFIAESTT